MTPPSWLYGVNNTAELDLQVSPAKQMVKYISEYDVNFDQKSEIENLVRLCLYRDLFANIFNYIKDLIWSPCFYAKVCLHILHVL